MQAGLRLLPVLTVISLLLPAHATQIISVDGNGDPIALGAQVHGISGNGRIVVLRAGSALLPEDTTGNQLYAYDLDSGDLELISVRPDGTVSDRATTLYDSPHSRVISSDGRFVLFRSTANDIVPGANPGLLHQLYLRDRQTMTTSIVSIANDGTVANQSIDEYTLDCSGVAVAFRTSATNLDDANQGGTFLHRTDAPVDSNVRTRRACKDSFGEAIDCRDFSISDGGGSIAFRSSAPDVSPDDPPGDDVFVGLPIDGNNVLITEDVGAIAVSRNHSAPAMNCAGSRVALRTNINLQFNPDGTNVPDLWVVGIPSGQKWLIQEPFGTPIVGSSDRTAMSDCGLLIGFETSQALDGGDSNGAIDGYVLELPLGGLPPYDLYFTGHWDGVAANSGSKVPRTSCAGTVAFVSSATNSPPWPNTQGFEHVFVNLPPDGLGVIFQANFQSP